MFYKSSYASLGELLFEGAKEEAERIQRECKHERIELVEAHETYQIGVCVNCKQLFKREKL